MLFPEMSYSVTTQILCLRLGPSEPDMTDRYLAEKDKSFIHSILHKFAFLQLHKRTRCTPRKNTKIYI